ncbi:MAG TPA: fumarylacetoacetate hydrolase family protein [Caulobacteraceae bacterium]|jgi:2-keto-4-pentenoate hydratase/2-oxohepta-3-ene-1,7-dioic acid hydratase in catechol pathway|nr:fumarylacetoacetate hydrolase family protein [Caulobacteraceae bacterium]
MKLATFEQIGNPPALGLVADTGGAVLDVQAAARGQSARACPEFASMQALIDAGSDALDLLRDVAGRTSAGAEHWLPLAAVRLLAPLPEPRQLRDFAGFTQHLIDGPFALLRLQAREKGEPPPAKPSGLAKPLQDNPLFYFGNRLNVVGHDAHIAWPRDARLMDFEVEIGAVIGRTAKDVSRDDAAACIFGYTIFNDVSARDIQGQQTPGGLGPCKAKSYDGCNVLGPWIVTRDELPSPYGGMARVRVNGELWAERPVTGTVHDFSDMIAFASRDETIHAGEVFGSGTVSGCCGLEMDRWIQRGDVVDLEVEGIGTLRNRYG